MEMQSHHGHAIYKDNRVLGPAEYSPQRGILERHIGTPTLSQRSQVSLVDSFSPFKSQLTMSTPGNTLYNGGPHNSLYTIVDDALAHQFYERTESATIFHDHDRRMGLDPNRRFCATPGPSLTHDSLLYTHSTSGISIPPTVHFGPDDIPFGDRTATVPAGPVYHPDYDSKHVRPTPKLSKISPSERRTFADLDLMRTLKSEQPESPTVVKMRTDLRDAPPSPLAQAAAMLRPKYSPVRMPILRTRKPPALSFDTSCYKAQAREQVELNPRSIDKLAKVGIFNEIMTQKRQYESKHMESKISEKIKRSAL